MSEQKMIIIYGVPGSGKSTIAASAAKEYDATVVNMDNIRTELYGEAYHTEQQSMPSAERNKKEKLVSATKIKRIRELLENGESVISDDTNIKLTTVRQLVSIAREFNVPVFTFGVDVPLSVAKERNKARGDAGGRYVPYSIIDAMGKSCYDDEGHLKEIVVDGSNVFYRE